MKRIIFVVVCLLVVAPLARAQGEVKLTRQQAVEDIRKLADIIESTHPDPYSGGGGKIEFQRRLYTMLRSVPNEGLTVEELYELMVPFVAQVHDAHTSLRPVTRTKPPRIGLPLGFKAIEKHLFVVRVYDPEHADLIGARLEALEGVSYDQLLERQGLLMGWENIYNNIFNLRRSLGQYFSIQSLLPEWTDGVTLNVTFQLANGDERTVAFELPEKLDRSKTIDLKSEIEMPKYKGGAPTFGFLDSERKIGYLNIANMLYYREAFEWYKATGMESTDNWARVVYKQINKTEAPEKLDDVIAGIPAATDIFRSMVIAMKEAGSTTLIIDLSDNGGGHSVLANVLAYFLYGMDAGEDQVSAYSINRYSELFFTSYKETTLENINKERSVPLKVGDYDFDSYFKSIEAVSDEESESDQYEIYKANTPSFYAELETGHYEKFYCPAHVIVLTSAGTFSSAYMLAAELYKLGAQVIGVPSGQSGNSFGDQLYFYLPHSGISGAISYKYFVYFPTDEKLGHLLQPHVELTFERWKSYNFDKYASVRLALDSIKN